MTSVDMTGDREPRYFGRRALAFLLDILVAQLVVALLFSAVDAATGTSLGDSASISASECNPAPATHPQVVRIDGMWPMPAGGQRKNTICHFGSGADESWTFTTQLEWKDGGANYSKQLSYSIDKDGRALPTTYLPDFGPLGIVLLFIILAAKGLRSPGKSLMGLKIVTREGAAPGWGHAIRREVLKLAPLVVWGGFSVWVAVAPPAFLSDSESMLVAMRDSGVMTSPAMLLMFGWYGGAILWWLAPFAIWHGRTWYDVLAGTKLVRTDRTRSTGPR